ncbi:MAG: class I SAM-dependent methyltransferase [Bacteroidota bacterium]|nr:class I SAM-dependent methyltransferase [Bacteroidota bacterium]
MTAEKNKWFETWFDTPYYHTLYFKRDTKEAEGFISTLVKHLKPVPDSKCWDLACGKGRHSIILNKQGLFVIGTDLSEQNILYAGQFEKEGLEFYRLDMRSPFRTNYFDYVVNLFTSFGYFEKKSDDLKVFKSVYDSLKQGGSFIFDYLNGSMILNCLVKNETKEIDGVQFTISKEFVKGRIQKYINIKDGNKELNFQESLTIYNKEEILAYATSVGLTCKEVFGNYNMEAFNAEQSDRMIFIFIKN